MLTLPLNRMAGVARECGVGEGGGSGLKDLLLIIYFFVPSEFFHVFLLLFQLKDF